MTFLQWMLNRRSGFFYAFYPCWNWKVGGVLVTYWLRTGVVKIYHHGGYATECYPCDTERCRNAVMELESEKEKQ
jgi:hypothetical protein